MKKWETSKKYLQAPKSSYSIMGKQNFRSVHVLELCIGPLNISDFWVLSKSLENSRKMFSIFSGGGMNVQHWATDTLVSFPHCSVYYWTTALLKFKKVDWKTHFSIMFAGHFIDRSQNFEIFREKTIFWKRSAQCLRNVPDFLFVNSLTI